MTKAHRAESKDSIDYPVRVEPLRTHYRRTFVLNNQLIRLRTLGEETFGVTHTPK